MRLTVVSGKGGVGKSMIASSLVLLFSQQFSSQSEQQSTIFAIDCDVDAPNLALWMGIDTIQDVDKEFYKQTRVKHYKDRISQEKNSLSIKADKGEKTHCVLNSITLEDRQLISTAEKPDIDNSKCNGCNKCMESCNFRALELINPKSSPRIELIPYRCEGCGLCEIVCPNNVIQMKKVNNCILSQYKLIGKKGDEIVLVQGQIKPGEAESGETVTEIRKYADEVFQEVFVSQSGSNSFFIQDAAAGIGCPVIASLVGTDFAIVVVEPSKSSISDMNRVLEVVQKFDIDYGIVINKWDLNKDLSKEIIDLTDDNFLGRVSFNEKIVESLVELNPIIGNVKKTTKEMKDIFDKLMKNLVCRGYL
jgi:MinD superfamily P-loop ATPase